MVKRTTDDTMSLFSAQSKGYALRTLENEYSAIEAIDFMTHTLGDKSFHKSSIYRWWAQFDENHFQIFSKERPGGKSCVDKNGSFLEFLNNEIQKNRRVSLESLRQKIIKNNGFDIATALLNSIIFKELGFVKRVVCW